MSKLVHVVFDFSKPSIDTGVKVIWDLAQSTLEADGKGDRGTVNEIRSQTKSTLHCTQCKIL